MSPSLKSMTVAVAAAAAIALPLSTACSAIAASTTAAGGASKSGSGAGLNQGQGQGPAKSTPLEPLSPFAPTVKPGLVGSPITLQDNVSLSGYDVAVDGGGRAYIGWISDPAAGGGRKIHLCTLPPGARRCQGGIQTVTPPDPLGPSTSQGLQVLATPGGDVTLVWMYDTAASESGPQGAELATATSHRGGPLSTDFTAATAPSFGTMLDATFGPNNSVWVVSQKSVLNGVQVREGLSGSSVNLHTPYGVGDAHLRFSRGTGVLVIQKAGAISANVAFATVRDAAFSPFSKVGKTWTGAANFGLTATTSGVRMVTSVDNASYHPVDWSFAGNGFGRPTLTGDLNDCAPGSHDLNSDASGRAVDVSAECSTIAIANLPDTRHASVTRFSTHDKTLAGGIPQISSTPRGTGWVAWSFESTNADKLVVAPFVLSDRTATASASSRGNRITVSGPASCLPPVDVPVGIKASTARNWHLVSRTLKLGSTTLHSATLRGGTLTAGKTYALTGIVKFASGGSHVTVTATLRFRSCPS